MIEWLKDLITHHTVSYGDYANAVKDSTYEVGYNTPIHVLLVGHGKHGFKVIW